MNNTSLSRGLNFLNAAPSAVGEPLSQQSTVYVSREYFVSLTPAAAKSDVDYLVSPMEQIGTQINSWLSRFGNRTRIKVEDAIMLVGQPAQIPQEYFDTFEPVFRTVMLYRAHVGHWGDDISDGPSEEQKNAALLGLANLIAARLPAPSPMFLEDGTIGAYWRRGKCYASIDFEIDGEHSWAGTDGVNFHSGTWKLPGEQVPPALVNELLLIGS